MRAHTYTYKHSAHTHTRAHTHEHKHMIAGGFGDVSRCNLARVQAPQASARRRQALQVPMSERRMRPKPHYKKPFIIKIFSSFCPSLLSISLSDSDTAVSEERLGPWDRHAGPMGQLHLLPLLLLSLLAPSPFRFPYALTSSKAAPQTPPFGQRVASDPKSRGHFGQSSRRSFPGASR
jgi:hypothetical protein